MAETTSQSAEQDANSVVIYTVDSFTEKPYGGNPAGVCLLGDLQISDAEHLLISREMNHSETAFITNKPDSPSPNEFCLRWFTPTVEVNLCGHGTLAAAHVLFNEMGFEGEEINFHTLSGVLRVVKTDNGLQMDFPRGNPHDVVLTEGIEYKVSDAFGISHKRFVNTAFCDVTNKLIIELEHHSLIKTAKIPSADELLTIQWPVNVRGIVLTAPYLEDKDRYSECDFVSRYFSPWNGIPEDPVNGSSHTMLPLYYQRHFNKSKFKAYAASKRSGLLWLEVCGKIVKISGFASTVLKGKINLPRL